VAKSYEAYCKTHSDKQSFFGNYDVWLDCFFLGFLFIVIHESFMGKEDSTLTNITMQTFASEGDIALVDQRWEKDGPAFLERLFAAGLLSYEKGQIWNKDSKLMRFVIFKYGSPEALKRCLPIWKEVEKHMFENVVVKVTAYRGVSSEYIAAN
jgi:hypothetical protein